jgi:hypothetical protein
VRENLEALRICLFVESSCASPRRAELLLERVSKISPRPNIQSIYIVYDIIVRNKLVRAFCRFFRLSFVQVL